MICNLEQVQIRLLDSGTHLNLNPPKDPNFEEVNLRNIVRDFLERSDQVEIRVVNKKKY